MFCNSCGTENVDAAQFCYKCGTVQVPAPPPASWAGNSPANTPPQPAANNSVQGYGYAPNYPPGSYPQPAPPPVAAAYPYPPPSPYAPAYATPQQVINVNTTQRPLVIMMPKSVGAAIVLAFFFGPLGMLYSTVVGGLVMLLVNIIIAIPTLGLGLLITWPVCIIWAGVAASNHNSNLHRYAQGG